MALDVRGKVALVTGATSGICLALTKALLEAGCNVLAFDLVMRDEAAQIFAGAKYAKVEFVQGDVTDWARLQQGFDRAVDHFGQLDIVVPGAGLFEPTWSSFWGFNTGVDMVNSNHFRTLEVNITHPIRATQLAIDSFMRQKLRHGVVVLLSSIAGQLPLLPTPLYSASKHAISAFARSLGPLEAERNIRVVAVAPGVVKTPIWTEDKLSWVHEEVDTWVPVPRVVQTIMDLITNKDHVGGTVLEVGVDECRPVAPFNDPGPSGKGHTVEGLASAMHDVYGLLDANFGAGYPGQLYEGREDHKYMFHFQPPRSDRMTFERGVWTGVRF